MSLNAEIEMDSRLRPPWTEVILGMQEQFPVRENDEMKEHRAFHA